jgi:hypothetical protein
VPPEPQTRIRGADRSSYRVESVGFAKTVVFLPISEKARPLGSSANGDNQAHQT